MDGGVSQDVYPSVSTWTTWPHITTTGPTKPARHARPPSADLRGSQDLLRSNQGGYDGIYRFISNINHFCVCPVLNRMLNEDRAVRKSECLGLDFGCVDELNRRYEHRWNALQFQL